MKQIPNAVAASLVLAMTALPCAAGGSVEPVADDAPPHAVADWSGAYLGLSLSRGGGDSFWAERGANADSTPGDWSGTLPGLSGGYDWQRGNLVFGVGLNYSAGKLSQISTGSAQFGCPGVGCQTEVKSFAALTGRVGYAFGNTLVYAKVGAARGKGRGFLEESGIDTGAGTLSGWTAGIGAEHLIDSHWSISGEFMKTDLGRLELPNGCGTDCYIDVGFNTVTLGLNYRW